MTQPKPIDSKALDGRFDGGRRGANVNPRTGPGVLSNALTMGRMGMFGGGMAGQFGVMRQGQ